MLLHALHYPQSRGAFFLIVERVCFFLSSSPAASSGPSRCSRPSPPGKGRYTPRAGGQRQQRQGAAARRRRRGRGLPPPRPPRGAAPRGGGRLPPPEQGPWPSPPRRPRGRQRATRSLQRGPGGRRQRRRRRRRRRRGRRGPGPRRRKGEALGSSRWLPPPPLSEAPLSRVTPRLRLSKRPLDRRTSRRC